MRQLLIGIAFVFVTAAALADQIGQTNPETYISHFGRYRLTVFPLEEKNADWTHAELMVNLPPPGQQRVQISSEATLERWVGNSYELIWRKPLVNKVSPRSALVSAADGGFVTFDDWGNAGYGENVVVVYSGNGDVVKKFALRDFMTEAEIEKVPHTIGSIHWGGPHILDISTGKTIILRIATNGEWDDDKQVYRDVRINMADGVVVD